MQMTRQTLAGQLKITDREITERKILFGITEQCVEALTDCRSYIYPKIDEIVDKFYQYQTSVPEVELVIGDAETLMRLSQAMRGYLLELFEGYYDADYVNKRLRIGKVHKNIGVSPKLYISAIAQLQAVLTPFVEAIPDNREKALTRESRLQAIQNIFLFDIHLVFDTYIASMLNEVHISKQQVENYASSLENEVAKRTEQLEQMSRHDALTGLANHHAFHEHLRRCLSDAQRNARPISLIYFDIDRFKEVNDSKGHKHGDKILEMVGKLTLSQIRANDIACRYGGDEFCIILPAATIADAQTTARRMIRQAPQFIESGVRFSIGIAQNGPKEFLDIDRFIAAADAAMYRAKESGRTNRKCNLNLAPISAENATASDLPPSHIRLAASEMEQ